MIKELTRRAGQTRCIAMVACALLVRMACQGGEKQPEGEMPSDIEDEE